jgi:hypothetical protein
VTLPATIAEANTGAAREEAPVLANFEFQQTGETVRVIDADGSVYDGRFLANAPAASVRDTFAVSEAVEQQAKGEQAQPRRPLAVRSDLALEKSKSQSQLSVTNTLPSYSFQVRGTNLRSQQPVELNGVFVPNAAPAGTQLGGPLQLAAPNQAEASKQGQGQGQGQSQNRTRFYRALPQNAPAPTAQGAAAPAQRPGGPATNVQMLQRIQGVLRVGGGNAQPLDAWQAQSEK